jgi:hypothetical protein
MSLRDVVGHDIDINGGSEHKVENRLDEKIQVRTALASTQLVNGDLGLMLDKKEHSILNVLLKSNRS